VFRRGWWGRRSLVALEDFSLVVDAERPTILAVVGESGSGKTTLARLLLGLAWPTAGTVRYRGVDLRSLSREGWRAFRRDVQAVFQDPFEVFNPFYRVDHVLEVPIARFRLARSRTEARALMEEVLEAVGLRPSETLGRYPHQLSGGQRQRVSIARALTVRPRLIVADEAVSMVDVSIRISLLNTLLELRDRLGVAFLFITHDLALARYFAWRGRIAVMYLGKLVELGATPRVIQSPLHPYTRALLSAIPEADPRLTRQKARLALRSLDVPSPLRRPPGCAFHPRCPAFVQGLCEIEEPVLREVAEGHRAACHVAAAPALPGEGGLAG